MSYTKNGLRALGVCLVAALGLMAFSAAAAQAQTGWLVNKAFITSTQKMNATIHPLPLSGFKHTELLAEPLGTKMEILCGVLAVDDGLIFANEKAEGLAAILLFTDCRTYLFIAGVLTESKVCKPDEPIEGKVKARAFLHLKKPNGESGDKKTYLLFEPEVLGGDLAVIKFPNEECVFNPSLLVSGTLVAECLNEKLEKNTALTDYCLEDLVHHLIQEAPNQKELFGDGMLVGNRPAALDGIADVTHSELKTWAVHI